jgi:hypothetical protein
MRGITAICLACALSLAAVPAASAQVRLDIGGIVLKELDNSSKDPKARNLDGFLDEMPLLPLPEADLSYQWELGLLKLGIGARVFSLFAESMGWLDAYAELDLGRAAIEAQAGGGAFCMAGILNQAALGQVFIPDLSAWLKLGRSGAFRIGAGAAGLYVPKAFGNTMTIILYAGGKTSISF